MLIIFKIAVVIGLIAIATTRGLMLKKNRKLNQKRVLSFLTIIFDILTFFTGFIYCLIISGVDIVITFDTVFIGICLVNDVHFFKMLSIEKKLNDINGIINENKKNLKDIRDNMSSGTGES